MSWEHDMARTLRDRDNRPATAWFSGTVASVSPLVVSCHDGQVMLRNAQLVRLAGGGQLTQGDEVALCGDPFSGAPGALRVLILGVIDHAV